MHGRGSSPFTGLLLVSTLSVYAFIVFIAVWMLADFAWDPIVIVKTLLAPSAGLIGSAVFIWLLIRHTNCHDDPLCVNPPHSNPIDLAGAPYACPRSFLQRMACVLTFASIGSLVFVPLLISVCYLNGDMPAFVPHRRTFYPGPGFMVYELGCTYSLFAAVGCSFSALVFAPTWKHTGLFGVCIVAFIGFRFGVSSLHHG